MECNKYDDDGDEVYCPQSTKYLRSSYYGE
jgi:hypothetical protein